jgi:hypothetical protein
MKSPTLNSVVPSARCAYRTPRGRRCRLPVADARSCLCPKHRAEQQQLEAADHYDHLAINYQEFQTAQGINHSLHNLYALLAQNRISARRAAVLSYISSLLLRTLPQIDADIAAGIKYPPKSLHRVESSPEEVQPPPSVIDLSPESLPGANSASAADRQAESDPADAWDPSNPEPDPEKKPS